MPHAKSLELEAQVYKALVHPTRVAILYALVDQAQTLSELARAVRRPANLVKHHLRRLQKLMLVTSDQPGRGAKYRLSDPRIIGAIEMFRSLPIPAHLRTSAPTPICTRQSRAECTD